jgi:hypothetical protein
MAEIYRGRLFFRADRSLGAKQEGLTIVHFLNKLIVSCKEAVRFPFYFFVVIFKLDSYFLLKLKGYFLYFTPIVHSMLKLGRSTVVSWYLLLWFPPQINLTTIIIIIVWLNTALEWSLQYFDIYIVF